jgi:fibronectin type 3 domain-containing protein
MLQWTASTTPNVTYNVYRCSISAAACDPSQPANFGSPIATSINATTYTDLTVSSGVTYYYALTAVDTTGAEGSLSGATSAVIP